MTTAWTFSPLLYRVAWQGFGRDVLPSPIQCRTGGMELDHYRRQLSRAAGLLIERWDEPTQTAFELMSWPDARIQLISTSIGKPTLRLHAAVSDADAVLAVQFDDGVGTGGDIRMSTVPAVDIAARIIDLLPDCPPGSVAAFDVPAAELDPDTEAAMPDSWLDHAHKTTPAHRMRRLLEAKRLADCSVLVCPGPDMGEHDSGDYTWNWIDLDEGRYLIYRNTRIGVEPHSIPAMTTHLARLTASVARRYRDAQF